MIDPNVINPDMIDPDTIDSGEPPAPTGAELEDVSIDLGGHPIVRNVSLNIPAGAVTALIGPNGSGKTTLLRSIYRAVKMRGGRVEVSGFDLAHLSRRRSARLVSAAVQESDSTPQLRVREVVRLGRLPYHGDLGRRTAVDDQAVHDAMIAADIADLAEREIGTLSGGQRQRVQLARALAQQTPVLILDEPTNHLDVLHQLELLALLRRLATDQHTTVVLALHDLTHAARSCDKVVVLDQGIILAQGTPEQTLTPEVIQSVFGVVPLWVDTPDGPMMSLTLARD